MRTPTAPGVSNEAVVAAYDLLAAPYDRLVAPIEAATRERALSVLSPQMGEDVLEVGCGPGHALSDLAAAVGPSGRALGLDAAPGMLSRARERASGVGHVTLVRGDARSLPLPDGAVDAAFVEDTLELFGPDDVTAVLGELRRVLAPGGRLVVVTMEREDAEDHPFVRAYEWAFEYVPGYQRVGCRPIYARRALAKNGFAVERRERHRRAYVWPVEILRARPAN